MLTDPTISLPGYWVQIQIRYRSHKVGISQVIHKLDAELASKTKAVVDDHAKELAGLKAQHEIALSQVCVSARMYCIYKKGNKNQTKEDVSLRIVCRREAASSDTQRDTKKPPPRCKQHRSGPMQPKIR